MADRSRFIKINFIACNEAAKQNVIYNMKSKIPFLALFILLSCSKGGDNIVLNTNLTGCLINSTCTYNYYDNADLSTVNQPIAGNKRVFIYIDGVQSTCGPSKQLYFKRPINETDFDITSGQIVAGDVVAYNFTCPCCEVAYIGTVVGGEIKGKRISTNQWLVNASIIFGTSINNPIDTVVVNQKFTLKTLL